MGRCLRFFGMVIIASLFGMFMLAAQGFAANLSPLAPALFQPPHYSPMPETTADEIVVYKANRMMYLLKKGHILRKYRIALGKNPIGHKLQWGDYRTPEGKYHIDMKNAQSGFYRSLRISYPDATDSDVASALDVKPGDWIMIHGMPNDRSAATMGHPNKDWTNGCIAVTNAEMDEIWRMVPVGTPISIWP